MHDHARSRDGEPDGEGSTAGEDRTKRGDETTPEAPAEPEEPTEPEAPAEPEEPTEPEEPAFEDMDPQALALASARAGFTAYYLTGTVESLGLDPAMLDEATLMQLIEQYLPVAVAEADRWLETLDPATLPLAVIPKTECITRFGCPYRLPCESFGPPVSHQCYVTDCDDAKCRQCPEIFAEIASRLVFKSWCTYICVQTGTSPPKQVADGIVFMTHWGNKYVGPWCIPR